MANINLASRNKTSEQVSVIYICVISAEVAAALAINRYIDI